MGMDPNSVLSFINFVAACLSALALMLFVLSAVYVLVTDADEPSTKWWHWDWIDIIAALVAVSANGVSRFVPGVNALGSLALQLIIQIAFSKLMRIVIPVLRTAKEGKLS